MIQRTLVIQPADARSSEGASLRLWAMLVAVAALSQFHRSCLGVIAPELSQDLSMTPAALGSAGGMFFVGIALAQIPVGMLFDRIGPRATVAALGAVAVLGALAQATAASGQQLAIARFILGFGCAANLMAAVTLCAAWYPPERLSAKLSWIYALGQLGVLAATAPLAIAAGLVGWRASFALAAACTGGLAALFWLWVRDRPAGQASEPRPVESLREVLLGLPRVWRTPGLVPVLAINAFATASVATVLGIWAGPYLADVHALDAASRGNVLLAMGVAQLAGTLAVGPLDRVFNTRKWVVVSGSLATILTLLALALVPRPPLWLTIGLLVLLCAVTTYGVVIMAHARSLFPAALVGRGVTTVNLAQVVGLAGLPLITGAIVGAFPAESGVRPEFAYRLAFGAIALSLLLGLALYVNARDRRPGDERPPS